jgi:hypothetical protein
VAAPLWAATTINSPEAVVKALNARGVLQAAEAAGLQRRVVVMLAQRLKPAEPLDFEQAITELERADVALRAEITQPEGTEAVNAAIIRFLRDSDR